MNRRVVSRGRAGRDLRTVRVLFLGSLLPAAVLSAVLVALQPSYARIAMALWGYGLVGWAALELVGRGMRFAAGLRNGRRWGLFLAAAAVHLLILTPEIALRVIGFRYETGIQFGYPTPAAFARFVHDEHLFWTLSPERPEINSWGFPGPEIGPPQPGRPRVVFLGDSVPYGGYPLLVERLMSTNGQPQVEVVNLSLPGYTSWQGLRVLDRYGDRVDPDVAVISYGWNDHWLAWGQVDADKRVRVATATVERCVAWLHRHARSLQAALAVRNAFTGGRETPLDVPRVPADQYRANIEALGQRLAEQNAIPLLLTSPSGHAQLGVPSYLLTSGLAKDDASVIDSHRRYNRIVREVAASRGWFLLDLEAALADHAGPDALFLADGIHLTPVGERVVAARVARAVATLSGL